MFFFSFFLPHVSHVHQAHHHEVMGKVPITSCSASETPRILLLQSQHAFRNVPVMNWPQLKIFKSVIGHQILPLPFYLKAHLSICSTLIRPQDFKHPEWIFYTHSLQIQILLAFPPASLILLCIDPAQAGRLLTVTGSRTHPPLSHVTSSPCLLGWAAPTVSSQHLLFSPK